MGLPLQLQIESWGYTCLRVATEFLALEKSFMFHIPKQRKKGKVVAVYLHKAIDMHAFKFS